MLFPEKLRVVQSFFKILLKTGKYGVQMVSKEWYLTL